MSLEFRVGVWGMERKLTRNCRGSLGGLYLLGSSIGKRIMANFYIEQ